MADPDGGGVTLVHDTLPPVVAYHSTTVTDLRALGYRTPGKQTAPPVGYPAATKAALLEEIRSRNSDGRDNPIPLTGTKDDLIAALEADDTTRAAATGAGDPGGPG